jgi:hypothetical protein
MEIRPIEKKDREPLAALIRRIETFSQEEVACATELVDLALTPNNKDYTILVADRDASLIAGMEGDMRRRGARVIRVETSATEAYGPTRGFYASMKYTEEARFRDFYKVGDDLIILAKRL